MTRILQEKGLARALADTPTNESASDSTTAEPVNNQAFTIISLNIRDSQIPHIQSPGNANEAWEALAKIQQDISSKGRTVLMQRLWSLQPQEGQNMSVHLNSFEQVSTQVANLSPNRIGMPDAALVSMVSLSLLESYEPLIIAIQSPSETLTFDLLVGLLLHEATRRQAARLSTTDKNRQALAALAARAAYHSPGYVGHGNNG